MKRFTSTIIICCLALCAFGQENTKIDTVKKKEEVLGAVLIKSFRVDADSPITHSNLSKEEIKKINLGQDLPILLNQLPGVVTASDAGNGVGYTYLRVRGSDATRINVTLNGIPFNDAESQGSFWVNLPDFASSTQSLQLQRGVGTSVNGSGAFGASLNLLTDNRSEEAYAEISNSFGSFNTRRHTVKASTGLLQDKFELSARLSNIYSDGYVDRATSDLKSYFLQGTYDDGQTLVKAVLFGGREETYQAYFGIDAETLETDRTFNPVGQQFDNEGNFEGFYDNEVDNYAQDHYQLHANHRFNANWSANVSLNYTYGRGYFEQYVDAFNYGSNLFDPSATYAFLGIDPITVNGEEITETDLIRRRWLDNDFYVISTNANFKTDRIDVDAGVFYSYYDGDHFGEILWSEFPLDGLGYKGRYYDGRGLKQEVTTFAKATFNITDRLSGYADLQGRFIDYEATGLTSDREPIDVDKTFNFFNPKAGLSYQLNERNQLYTSYGRANREPRRSDFEENATVRPETLDDYELGWRFSDGKLQLNVNGYFMNYQDQLVLTGAIDDVGARIRENVGSSYRLGIELDARIPLTDMINLQPNLALSTNKNRDFLFQRDGALTNLGDTNIAFSPEIVGGGIIEVIPVEDFYIRWLAKYVGEQYMGNIDSEASILNSFFTNDLNVSYEWKNPWFFDVITFSGLLNNLFDVEYEPNGYFFTFDDDFSNPGEITTIEGAGYYPVAGRNFLLGATLRF
ncbi:TonB-dependent receptor [Gangjinia marincola]|uniref:TonB-dependent receptor n=1 Tax=Gangjinia marincola TaxID=578463 RepID=A0ABP3XXH7_9FLAO